MSYALRLRLRAASRLLRKSAAGSLTIQAHLMAWSRICDAPTDCVEWDVPAWSTHPRVARVLECGTSARYVGSAKDVIGFNRAGKNESCLSIEQMIEFFCRRGGEGELPEGARREES